MWTKRLKEDEIYVYCDNTLHRCQENVLGLSVFLIWLAEVALMSYING